MKSWMWAMLGVLGVSSPGGAAGWNVLNTSSGARDAEVVVTFDLKGSACVVNLKGGRNACQQRPSAAPFQVKLTRSRTEYPDGQRYDTLSLVRTDGSNLVVWTVDECKTQPNGSGFQLVSFALKAGRGGWLEIHTVEHALPAKNDPNFRPGPPLVNRYVYSQGTYVLERS
jgi:hypothetical protein